MKNEDLWRDSLMFSRELMAVLPLMPEKFRQSGQENTFDTKERDERVGKYDVFVQGLLQELFAKITPGVLVTSEEISATWPPPPTESEYWAIDPIDGTHDMALGMPLYGTMGTFIQNNHVMFSFVYLPAETRMESSNRSTGFYFASRGNGARLLCENPYFYPITSKLKVSTQANLGKAMILVEGSTRSMPYQNLALEIMKNHRTRNLGASCWSGTRVALGNALPISVDALVISGVKPFDSLPIAFLIEEAGGKVTDMHGQPYSPKNFKDLIMSNGILHDELLSLAKKHVLVAGD